MNTNLQLRPHQTHALNSLRSTWKQSNRHLLAAPCGAGKTAIAAEIAAGFLARGMRVLFIAPYVALMDQTAKAFMSYGLPQPGFIWRDHEWTDSRNQLQIASADTIIRRDFPDTDVIIVDECHIRRKKLLEIMEEIDIPVIGLSATPFSKWLGNHYDNFIKVATVRQLIDQGFLSDFEIFAPTKPDLSKVRSSAGAAFGSDYLEAELAEIMGDSQIIGCIISTWLELGGNQPTIAFCCNVAHANHVTIEFNRAGVNAEVMTAKTPIEERQQIIARFESGVTKIICNCGVLIAGFDADVRTLIYARPTKSEIRWLQCLGRAMRTAPGKTHCTILDHSGTTHRLGFPDAIEYDSLHSDDDGMSEAAKQAKEQEKKEKLPKPCSQCHYMKPAGVYVCPKCGHKPLSGENVEADESRGLTKLKGKTVATKEDKQRFWSEIRGVQRERRNQGKNMSDGQLAHLYRSRFSVWPKGLMDTPTTPSLDTRNYLKSRAIAYAKGRAKG